MSDDQRIQSHRDLKVWQFGMEIAELIYRVTRQLPDDERFGLISQLRRSAVSVPAISLKEMLDHQQKNIYSIFQSHSAPWQKLKHSSISCFDSAMYPQILLKN